MKTTLVNQGQFRFSLLWERIEWPPQQGLIHLPTHVGKLHLASYSLREKASQEGLGATPRLPQERGKGKRRDREEGLSNLPCNPISLVLSLREEDER